MLPKLINPDPGGPPPGLPQDHDVADVLSTLDAEIELNRLLPNLVVSEATALLIDGNNWFKVANRLGMRINYGPLRKILAARCDLQVATIYVAHDKTRIEDRGFLHSLRQSGYTCKTRRLRKSDVEGKRVVTKTNVDVSLTIGAMLLDPDIKHVIIGSCDGDFVELVEELHQTRKVSIIGIGGGNDVGMSRSLIKSGDSYYDLLKMGNGVVVPKR